MKPRAAEYPKLTGEDFDWIAMEISALQDRSLEVNKELTTFTKIDGKEAIVDSFDEACRYQRLQNEFDELDERCAEIAERLFRSGFPQKVWVRITRHEAPSLRMKLWKAPNGTPLLKLEIGG